MPARSLLPERLAALAGVLFVALAGAGAALGDPYDAATDPNPTQPAAALAAALVRNRDRARLGAYLVLIGVFFLFWFVVYLHGRLREAEGEQGWRRLQQRARDRSVMPSPTVRCSSCWQKSAREGQRLLTATAQPWVVTRPNCCIKLS